MLPSEIVREKTISQKYGIYTIYIYNINLNENLPNCCKLSQEDQQQASL